MSRLYYHEKSDKRKWIAVSLILVLIIAAIVSGVCTDWYTEKNKFCLFGHDYGEDNKCIRCGAEQPAEESNEPEPQALISERVDLFASASLHTARRLATANDGIFTQANAEIISLSSVPSGYRLLQVGDNLSDIDSFVININAITRNAPYVYSDVFTTNDSKLKYFAVEDQEGFNFGFADSYTNLTQYNEDSAVDLITWGALNSSRPYIQFKVSELYYMHLYVDGTVSAIDSKFANAVYVKLVSKQLPPAPTKTGYTFSGWYTDAACTNKYTSPTVTSDITLYAGFRANTYSIKFNANSGSGNMANEAMTYDQSKALTANTFSKEHYSFKGWATSADGEVVYANNAEVKNLTATDGAVIELFAVWERSEVSVTFVSEGNTVATTWIAIGTKATLPETPVKEGHLFDGWYYEDGTEYEEQNISEDITLTAKFSIIRCTVTFIVDGEVYAVYVCDWGTSIAQALNGAGVNTALYKADEHSRNF